MAQVDFAALNSQLENLTVNVGKLASAIGSPVEAEPRIATLEQQNTALQADLDASQAAEADIAAKFAAQNAAIAALLPPAS